MTTDSKEPTFVSKQDRDKTLDEHLNTLNDDLLGVIYKHLHQVLPPTTKVWLTRDDYIIHHKSVKSLISPRFYDNYVHDIVRHDCAFVFEQLLKEHFQKWHKWKKYIFKGSTYKTYLSFLMDYASLNHSLKCIYVLNKYASLYGFSRNWYKQNRIIVHSNGRNPWIN